MKPLLDPTKLASKQEVFDAVARFALRPDAHPCRDDTIGCRYRSDDQINACFVGCLMTDEEARIADTEAVGGANTVYGLANRNILPDRLRGHLGLLDQLQGVHDADEPETWRDELFAIASNLGLDTGVLTKPEA